MAALTGLCGLGGFVRLGSAMTNERHLGDGKAGFESPAGEARFLDDFARRHYSALLRYFTRRGIAVADAEDLAQEVFARLVRRGNMGEVESADGYLFTIAGNLAADHFRRRSVRAAHPPESYHEAIHVAAEPAADAQLARRQELELIIEALHEMPERMRSIFILARLESLARAEIAVRIGVAKRDRL